MDPASPSPISALCYHLLPSIAAIFVGLWGTQSVSTRLSIDVRRMLQNNPELAEPVIDTAIGWHFKIGALTTLLLFIPSWISAISAATHAWLLLVGGVLVCWVALFCFAVPYIFMAQTDQLAAQYEDIRSSFKRRLKDLFGNMSDVRLYGWVLLIPHFLLLTANLFLYWPAQAQPPASDHTQHGSIHDQGSHAKSTTNVSVNFYGTCVAVSANPIVHLLGYVGPFVPGQADAIEASEPSKGAISICNSQTVTTILQQVKRKLQNEELDGIVIVGGADKFDLRSATIRRYGSNLGLAQARATKVRGCLSSLPAPLFVVVTETSVYGRGLSMRDRAVDRRVGIFALWSGEKN